CGNLGFKLTCQENNYSVIEILGSKYRVMEINQTAYTMRIARIDLWKSPCSNNGYGNTTLDDSLRVPILDTSMNLLISKGNLQESLNEGFDIEFSAIGQMCRDCKHSGMVCIYEGMFRCVPLDGFDFSSSKRTRNLAIGLGVGLGGILISCAAYFCITRLVSLGTLLFFWKETESGRKAEAVLRQHGFLAPKRFSYSEVKKMTNSFKEKLGQGGYGSVCKGKFHDDRLVAVKILNEAKGNGEEFINEVASISRTSHVNVITLLGFCLQGQRHALIYEFMPNGSLEKFIYCETHHLGWEKLFQIATGIARGLEYLHRGCNTRILHFDIKPHNILLDVDFCPKISDFGLAKLCTTKESSTISMLEARGTIGYIAPEVFNRHFGGVPHKSDVYSYGMMLLEMVGGRKNFDIGADHSSEIFFPQWLYTHLQGDVEFQLSGGMTTNEIEIAKKIIMVGLWCVQTIPSDRPSMSKVTDMLEGNLGALEVPPKPFRESSPSISSIPSSMSDSSSTPLTSSS
ncbi:LEAF RUST 10 DISEASE-RESISTANCEUS RECEPTOR-LIKE PROTEIN KINASE-like 2.4, partial [Rutidosis leptorrhynchoides]|uniref:LEAF RUST 10 DISEASE-RESISTANCEUS RECEPTOR-LIKE PROTEIN KINASE-like 2.4 n=1 Tax=Rutidosis leptorrhynchoides TaxID=125765 RepID=UPI003A99D3C0